MKKLDKANIFIENNKHLTNNKPKYHYAPPYGWLNDPNGFSYFKGEYHLFYQAYPYDVSWNDMHWGHAISKDMVKWEYKNIVMANDTLADANGVFSGSAIEKDNKLHFMYTGHIDPNLMHARVEEEVRQYQNLAIYNENGTVTKYENNPVIGEKELPKGYKICDFRDPKVYKRGYSYYCILSVRNKDDVGSIVLYKSNDLINWDFFSEIYTSNPLDNILYECADLFQIDDKDVLIYSVMPARGEHSKVVKNCVKYAIGYMNYEKGIFEEDTVGLLDYGASFYAPQTTMDENGNVIIIGWLCERCEDTKKYLEEYKYNGIMSMVRELKIVDNKLISIPINNIKNFFRDEVVYENIKLNGEVELDYISGKATYIHLDIKEINKEIKISLFNKDDKSFDFIFSNNAISYLSSYTAKNNNTINIDTIKNIEIFIDNHVIEVFINNGEKVITELCYDSNKGDKIKFIGNKETISKITKYSV